MLNTKAWMLGAAVLATTLGLAAPKAQAAEFGIYVGGPAAYVPPCPGPGYFWTAGYYSGGYWVPGRWEFRGVVDRDDFYRRYDRDDFRYDRGRDFDRGRGWDGDRRWNRDGDHFRGDDRH